MSRDPKGKRKEPMLVESVGASRRREESVCLQFGETTRDSHDAE